MHIVENVVKKYKNSIIALIAFLLLFCYNNINFLLFIFKNINKVLINSVNKT